MEGSMTPARVSGLSGLVVLLSSCMIDAGGISAWSHLGGWTRGLFIGGSLLYVAATHVPPRLAPFIPPVAGAAAVAAGGVVAAIGGAVAVGVVLGTGDGAAALCLGVGCVVVGASTGWDLLDLRRRRRVTPPA